MWLFVIDFTGKSIAVDIDGTLFIGNYKYPDLGEPNTILIDYLNRFRKLGGIVIIYSLREKTSPKIFLEVVDYNGITLMKIYLRRLENITMIQER